MFQSIWTGTFWPKGQAAQNKTGNLLRILSRSVSCYCEENVQYSLSLHGSQPERRRAAQASPGAALLQGTPRIKVYRDAPFNFS